MRNAKNKKKTSEGDEKKFPEWFRLKNERKAQKYDNSSFLNMRLNAFNSKFFVLIICFNVLGWWYVSSTVSTFSSGSITCKEKDTKKSDI